MILEKILACGKFLASTLLYIIYPPLCPRCHEIVEEQGQFCETCAKKIYRLDTKENFPDVLSGVMRITKYRGGTRDNLLRLKFNNNLNVLPALQKILDAISNRDEIKNFLAEVELATFVPLHEKRLKERGYNQTELLFKDWLVAQNLPAENLLVRKKFTPKLYDHTPAERQEIMKGAFELLSGVEIHGKNILIVDDIYTTGTTVSECARILKAAGAAKIFVLAFASDFGD